MSQPDFITMPARLGREAMLVYNDTWPGELTEVPIGSLAREAARMCAERMVKAMDQTILAAFRQGLDYVVVESGYIDDRWSVPDGNFEVTFGFKGRPSSPGEFDDGLPFGWRLYSLKDWQQGKMP